MREALQIAGRSLRENLVPMLMLQVLAAVLVAAYLWIPGVAEALTPVGDGHRLHFVLGTLANRLVFCGFVPGLVLWALPSLRPNRCLLTLAVETLWCASLGLVCECFTQFQVFLFGDVHAPGVLLAKTLVDQLGFSAVVTVPLNAVVFFWIASGMSVSLARRRWPSNALTRIYLPNLVCNWVVWGPVNYLVYVFPQALQVQMGGLIGSFYVLLCLRLGKNGTKAPT